MKTPLLPLVTEDLVFTMRGHRVMMDEDLSQC
jgi:hypothetical protein